MTIDSERVHEPTDDRLAGIKATGRQRRARRRARYSMAGVGLAMIAAVPLAAMRTSEPPSPPLAAGQATECRNSTRPECGPFRWEPAPSPNQPLRANVIRADVHDGHTATVVLRWEDPDAARAEAASVCWEEPCPPPPSPCRQTDASGAWIPPPATPGSGELRYTHDYSTPGARQIVVVLRSHAWPERSCAPGTGDPYSDTVTIMATVAVSGP